MKTTTTRKQRNRNVQYSIADDSQEGLNELIRLLGIKQAVGLLQEPFIARNPLLSRLDLIDKGEYKGDEVYPDRDDEEVIHYDLLAYLAERKAGTSRTKWGNLKAFLDQAKELIKQYGLPDTEEKLREVATKCREKHLRDKAEMMKELGYAPDEEETEDEDNDEETDA